VIGRGRVASVEDPARGANLVFDILYAFIDTEESATREHLTRSSARRARAHGLPDSTASSRPCRTCASRSTVARRSASSASRAP